MFSIMQTVPVLPSGCCDCPEVWLSSGKSALLERNSRPSKPDHHRRSVTTSISETGTVARMAPLLDIAKWRCVYGLAWGLGRCWLVSDR